MAPVPVAVQPIIQKCLVEIGGDDLLAEFVGVGADERQAQAGQHSDQRLRDAVGVGGAVRIFGFDLGQRRSDHEEAVRKIGHPPQPLDENSAIRRERADQVGEILTLDRARVFHAFDGVIAEAQGAMLDFFEPPSEASERERILLAGVDDRNGQWRAELRASALGDDGQRGVRDGRGERGPLQRRRDQSAFAGH